MIGISGSEYARKAAKPQEGKRRIKLKNKIMNKKKTMTSRERVLAAINHQTPDQGSH